MATTRQVYTTVERWQHAIAGTFGTDLDTAPVALRALAHADAAVISVLAATLINKGVVTSAEFLATWQEAATDVGWTPDS